MGEKRYGINACCEQTKIVGCGVSQKRPWRGKKKRRTREHVIADLAVNYVQRHILLNGHSSEEIVRDYGIDLLMFTYNSDREIENGHVQIQIKATENITVLKTTGAIAFQAEVAHLQTWQWEPMPVILVVYDAVGDGRAFWVYIQNYLNSRADLSLDDQETLTVQIPQENQLDAGAIERFRGFRDKVLAEMEGVISHDG
jgi:hypothetical protein